LVSVQIESVHISRNDISFHTMEGMFGFSVRISSMNDICTKQIVRPWTFVKDDGMHNCTI